MNPNKNRVLIVADHFSTQAMEAFKQAWIDHQMSGNHVIVNSGRIHGKSFMSCGVPIAIETIRGEDYIFNDEAKIMPTYEEPKSKFIGKSRNNFKRR